MKPTEPTDLPLSPAEASELPAGERAEWLEAIAAAYRPSELDPERHLELLERALDAAWAPASAEELTAAESLRRALANGDVHADAEVLRALKAAFAPSALSRRNEARFAAGRAPRKVGYVALAAGSLAMAAALLLWLATNPGGDRLARSADDSTLSLSRSTAALFDAPFATDATSARIDRIAEVRQAELRNNRYRAWGVR